MDNVKTIKLQITGKEVTVCYTRESHDKYMKNKYGKKILKDFRLKSSGQVTFMRSDDGSLHDVIVGVGYFKKADIRHAITTLVHELSHVTTAVMDSTDIKCDEFRSYTIEFLFETFEPFITELISTQPSK